MIKVRIDDDSFSYDIHSLVKAFYPEEEVKIILHDAEDDNDESGVDLELSVRKSFRSEEDRQAYKSELKRQLYRMLSEHTGKQLPWGTLTGIRPTKLAMGCIEKGSNEEDTAAYMRDFYLCSDEKALLATDIAIREHEILKGIAQSTEDDDMHDILAQGYSLYVGIPFCPSRCVYCSFMSYPIAGYSEAVDGYIDAVKRELHYVADAFADRRLDSIYIGGGTPTTLSVSKLSDLIGYIRDVFDISHIREFTVEAGRADSIDREKLAVLRQLGADRISVNPQTFNEDTLRLIGRKAGATETIEAYNLARDVGFDNINMDIILGLPGEDTDDVKHTLDVIKTLRPDDLTVHSLAVKRGSRLAELLLEGHKIRNDRIDYDEAMHLTSEAAADLGLKPYYLYRQKNISGNLENTGYAAAGREGIYNILMMEEVQDIVACGAGTVSKHVSLQPDGNTLISRCDTHKDLKLYTENIDEMIDRKRRLYRMEDVE